MSSIGPSNTTKPKSGKLNSFDVHCLSAISNEWHNFLLLIFKNLNINSKKGFVWLW